MTRPTHPTRRQLLQVGGAGLFGLSLPDLRAAACRSPGRKAKARAVIFLHQSAAPARPLKSGQSDRAVVEELYFAALCRPPGEKERAAAQGLLERAKDRRAALEDLAWGLLNAKEFLLRR